MPRMIFHNLASRLSVGVDIESNTVFVAFSICKHSDEPSRRFANARLHGQLNGTKYQHIGQLRSSEKVKFGQKFYIGPYEGGQPNKEVFGPVRDMVRNFPPPTKRRSLNRLPFMAKDALKNRGLVEA